MEVIVFLILASLSIAVGFLIAFIWAVRTGQYDDDYTPSVRMLFDDKPTENRNTLTPIFLATQKWPNSWIVTRIPIARTKAIIL